MLIEVESHARVDDLSTQRKSDQHLRNMRHEVEGHLRDGVIPAWRRGRQLPRWLPAERRARLRRMPVTRAEAALRKHCYLEACRQIQDGINRNREIDRARAMSGTTSREVSGCIPTA